MSEFVGVVTSLGQAKIAAAIGGAALNLTTIRVGDGGGAEITPNEAMTNLVRRVGGAYPIISSGRDPSNPTHWRVAAVIPAADGPFDIREIGVFDAAGDMIAIARHVRVTKLSPAQGAAIELETEVVFPVSETAQVTVTVPPDGQINLMRLMRAGWLTVNSATVTAPPGVRAIGDTYLVPTGATGAWAQSVGRIVQWDGVTWSGIDAPIGFLIADASAPLSSPSRYLRRDATQWVPANASRTAYGFARRADLATTWGSVDDEAFLTAAMLQAKRRITWQYLGDVTVVPDVYGALAMAPASATLGTDVSSAGGGFTVGPIDAGYYNVLIRLRRLLAADVFQMGIRLTKNGTEILDALTSEVFSTGQRIELRGTIGLNIGPGDIIRAEAFQTGAAATSRTCSITFVANRMSGY